MLKNAVDLTDILLEISSEKQAIIKVLVSCLSPTCNKSYSEDLKNMV